MGTEYSYQVLKAMYDYLASRPNFEFRERTTAESILTENGKAVRRAPDRGRTDEETVSAPYVVLAPGRGGAEWLSRAAGELGLPVTNNEVDIGVRVEVPNAVMDPLTKHLYEAKLVYYSDTFENKVRTFCMNPGGIVSEEHYDTPGGGIAVVNGHSYAEEERRTENTNFAMLVSTRFTEPFNQPIEYGRYIAQLGNMLTGGGIMVQRLGDLLLGRRTDAATPSEIDDRADAQNGGAGRPFVRSAAPPPDEHRRVAARVRQARAGPVLQKHAALRRRGKILLFQSRREEQF